MREKANSAQAAKNTITIFHGNQLVPTSLEATKKVPKEEQHSVTMRLIIRKKFQVQQNMMLQNMQVCQSWGLLAKLKNMRFMIVQMSMK